MLDQIESCNWQGVEYVAVNVCPRGFANEFAVYVMRADDAEGVSRLQAKVDKTADRQPGERYDASWVTAAEIARHIHTQRAPDGAIYLLTLDANGERDAIVI